MARSRRTLAAIMLALVQGSGDSCGGGRPRGRDRPGSPVASGTGADARTPLAPRRPERPRLAPLNPGEVYVYDERTDGGTTAARTAVGAGATRVSESDARAAGLLVVDLGDGWAPFIFQDSGGASANGDGASGETPKPNAYRQTFVELANDRVNADGRRLDPVRGEHNFFEPFGIPPTLSVLRDRVERDAAPGTRDCGAGVDLEGLRAFTGTVAYVDREHARRELAEAERDARWLEDELARRREAVLAAKPRDAVVPADVGREAANAVSGGAVERAAAIAALRSDANPGARGRLDRALRGQERIRAVRAAQARLVCDGLLAPHGRFTPGAFDLPTHQAIAEWERKNDIFAWAALGGETLAALSRPPLDLDFETLRRVLAERVADAAGIVEDGSTAKGSSPATYLGDDNPRAEAHADPDAGVAGVSGSDPKPRQVPNLIEDHVSALLASMHVTTTEDLLEFFRQFGGEGLATLRVAFRPPPLPPYYGAQMDLSVEIDRGDVWYDFFLDSRGRPLDQAREHYPHLTLFVTWRGQKIPLGRWRTTIGSWRSELHANGRTYYKYKNSDVGPRLWKNIVAGPVWIPPDSTPARDLLTRKVLDRDKGPEVVVNTDVMGPGFQSAYGLVMAIHIDRHGFDNQIRTHGSVDYTSIARRFSHGCHRLVNSRAVRLFDFVLRRQPFRRIGDLPLSFKRELLVDGSRYSFELKTRGYYYELVHPVPVNVDEGRIMGAVKAPITAYVRKPGVDYRGVDVNPEVHAAEPRSAADSATSIGVPEDPAAAAIGP